jgi:hypothetical protein
MPTELGWTTRVVAEGREAKRDSPFAAGLPLTGFGRDRYRIEQELRGRAGPVSLLLTATESGQEGSKPTGRFLAHEAYADLVIGGERISVGKKQLSGDVAYGFRPIDVLQRESRLQLAPPPLEGIPMLSWDNFSSQGAWSLVLANPGHGRRGEARDDGSIALEAVSPYHQRRPARRAQALGAPGHGVWRRRFRGTRRGAGTARLAAATDAWRAASACGGRGRHRAIAECGRRVTYRRDRQPAQGADWRHLDHGRWLFHAWRSLVGWHGARCRGLAAPAASGRQRAALLGLPGVPAAAVAGATAASLRIFDQGNLARRGALARLAWSDSASGWSASPTCLARWMTADGS